MVAGVIAYRNIIDYITNMYFYNRACNIYKKIKALKECKHISLLQHNYIISCAVMQEVEKWKN